MAQLPTIQQSINIGKATVFLMGNDYSRGSLFGKRLTNQNSSVLIAYCTAALEWQYDALPATDTLRGTANYLLWLCGRFRLEAASYTGGGGSVLPITPGGQNEFPFWVFSSNFESDGVTILDSRLNGVNVAIFINEFSQQWLGAGLGYFIYVSGGIEITIPGFDANTQDYTIMVQQVFSSGGGSTPTTDSELLINTTDSLLINTTDSLLIS